MALSEDGLVVPVHDAKVHRALRRLRRMQQREGIPGELRRRRHALSPGEAERHKRARALRRRLRTERRRG